VSALRPWGMASGLGLLALLGLAGVPRAALADGAVRSEVDARRVGVHDIVQLTITVEGSSLPDQVPLPRLTNLRLAGGPSVSTQMSWVNGRSSQSRSWTYALQPLAVGAAEVGAVTVKLESVEQSAPAIPIEVVAGSVQPPPSSARSNDPLDEDPFNLLGRRKVIEPRVFVEARPSRTNLYVGEPLLVTYYVYTQASVSGLQFSDAPQFAGFWAEDLQREGQPRGESVAVGGMTYTRFPILMKLLFPTRAGRLSVPASTLTIGLARQSLFDAGGAVQRSTAPFTVEVKPIPDEPGFSGAVGRFRAGASLDRSSLAFGEAATLRFQVEGSGNLKWIDRAPELVVPGARVYPPQVKSDLKPGPAGITGSRTWEFVVVPQTSGTLEIPALTFSYFDPSTGRVQKSVTAPLPLRVAGGAPGAVPPQMPGAGPVARGGPLALRADLERRPERGGASGRTVAWAVAGVLLLHGLLLSGDGLARLGRPRHGRAAAPRSVRTALGDLQRVGREGLSKEKSAGLIEKTLHGVFGSLEGDDSERARVVRALLDDVHAVRYAPQLGDYSEKLRELALRASEVVRRWA